jgi:hypothetical protein
VFQASDGSWYVTTHGFGNNEYAGMAGINQWQGPEIFRELDGQMRAYVQARKGTTK